MYKVVVVEGIIGSGKTNFSRELTTALDKLGGKTLYITEPDELDGNPYLAAKGIDIDLRVDPRGVERLVTQHRADRLEWDAAHEHTRCERVPEWWVEAGGTSHDKTKRSKPDA